MDYEDKAMKVLLTVLVIALIGLTGIGFYAAYKHFTNPYKCAVYGELETRKGFVMSGKIAVPTTYQTRPCVVYEYEKERVK